MKPEDLTGAMAESLDHLRIESRKREADRAGWQASIKNLSDRISEASETLSEAIDNNPNNVEIQAPARERLRLLKNERAALKAPSGIDPYPNVVQFLGGVAELQPVAPIPPDIKGRETPLAALNRVKALTDKTLREIQGVVTAPEPSANLIASIDAQVDAVADRGAPMISSNGQLTLKQIAIPSANGPVYVDDAVSLVAFALRDQLKNGLRKLATTDNGVALAPAERKAQLAALYDRFTTQLRSEAILAIEAEKADQRVVRRPHIYPAILLGAEANPTTVFDYYNRRRGA